MSTRDLAITLFGKTRRLLLAVLYGHPTERFYLRQLTAAAGVAVGAAQRELAELTAAGIISRVVEGRQVYFQANRSCAIFEELQGIVCKTVGRVDRDVNAVGSHSDGSGNAPHASEPPAPSALAVRDARQAVDRSLRAPSKRATTPTNPAFVWMARK